MKVYCPRCGFKINSQPVCPRCGAGPDGKSPLEECTPYDPEAEAALRRELKIKALMSDGDYCDSIEDFGDYPIANPLEMYEGEARAILEDAPIFIPGNNLVN